jgi:GNAT superfamily N-acetyltransferase
MVFGIGAEDPASLDARLLIDELSNVLAGITGDSGKASFDADEMHLPGAVFLVARDDAGNPAGCGALRPLTAHVAELKRMYARPTERGAGTALLAALEAHALALGYGRLWLSTRVINLRAVAFYQKHGYRVIANYGKYHGNALSVCLEKPLSSLGR